MSNFNYTQYQDVVNKAQNNTNSSTKIGFFKLPDDGDEALVRFNVASLDDLQFATVHQMGAAQKWMKVSCLNPIGSYSDNCPLCKAVAEGRTDISKAKKVVFVQMLAAYRDKTTGAFSTPIPVVWERPAGFARELANKLKDFGSLKETLLKITRNGKAGDMQTTYSIDYAVPTVFKPELVPADFSAFNNFNIAKHSYWEKSLEEINTFLTTGAFPEVIKKETVDKETKPTVTAPAPSDMATTEVSPQASTQNITPAVPPTAVEPSAPARPVRNFNTDFSF